MSKFSILCSVLCPVVILSGSAHTRQFFFCGIIIFCDSGAYAKFPLAPMGVFAPGSAHARPPARPPSTLEEIFRHACPQGNLQTSPPSPSKVISNVKTKIVVIYKGWHIFSHPSMPGTLLDCGSLVVAIRFVMVTAFVNF